MFRSQNVWVTRIGALVAAFVANLVVLFISRGVGANIRAEGPGYDGVTKVEPMHVANGSLSWGIAALIVFLLINRFAPGPARWWPIAGVVGLLLSFIPLFTGAVGTGTHITFVIMHLIAAGIIIPAFAATVTRR
jgi:hypothetical protein